MSGLNGKVEEIKSTVTDLMSRSIVYMAPSVADEKGAPYTVRISAVDDENK